MVQVSILRGDKMNNEKWDGSDLSGLPSEYLLKVLENMNSFGAANPVVRFGTMGTGARPNYQVTSDKQIVSYASINHEKNEQTEMYEDKNLSVSYTYEEINNLLKKRTENEQVASKLLMDYYRQNRASLPPNITKYREDILHPIMSGVDVKEAFETIIRLRNLHP